MVPAPELRSDRPDLVAAYREHARLVERVLRRGGVAERDVPDARQDVFLIAHRKLPGFEGRGRLSTWLYRIAWNVASEHRRRACQRRERLSWTGDDPEPHERELVRAGDEGSHALRLEQRELLAHAFDALEALDDDKREAFVLAEVVGLSMREIAARAGCPIKTAFSRAYAARRRVLATLRERGVVLGLVPAWLPLRFQLRRVPASAIGAHAQLGALALACATLPAIAGPGAEHPATDGVAVLAPAAVTAQASSASAPGVVLSASAPLEASTAPSASLPRAHSSPAASPRGEGPYDARAPSPRAAPQPPELIVFRDGNAWLMPAIEHPLDKLPAAVPALPPYVLRRGPRHELGRLDAPLPPID